MVVIGAGTAVACWLPGCVTPPRNPHDLCEVFTERPGWYRSTLAAEKRWNIDQATQMAVIFQESSFRASARPPRKKLLGFIPWTRPSSAYGYAQVLDSTWDLYRRVEAKSLARRDRFGDATRFVGWYLDRVAAHANIDKTHAGTLYLAYHEGAGGFTRGTHLKKQWLLNAASRVNTRAIQYRTQLTGCGPRLKKQSKWWRF